MVDISGADSAAWVRERAGHLPRNDVLQDQHLRSLGNPTARAGLTLPHSSGKVEGHVNRIKMIKRQMYGRANPDLLRKRILLAD
jgi:hypothetical protein